MPKTNFAPDFRAEINQEGLRRKGNDQRRPINLGPRILKIVFFDARRRLLHPHFGLGSNAKILVVALLPRFRARTYSIFVNALNVERIERML